MNLDIQNFPTSGFGCNEVFVLFFSFSINSYNVIFSPNKVHCKLLNPTFKMCCISVLVCVGSHNRIAQIGWGGFNSRYVFSHGGEKSMIKVSANLVGSGEGFLPGL